MNFEFTYTFPRCFALRVEIYTEKSEKILILIQIYFLPNSSESELAHRLLNSNCCRFFRLFLLRSPTDSRFMCEWNRSFTSGLAIILAYTLCTLDTRPINLQIFWLTWVGRAGPVLCLFEFESRSTDRTTNWPWPWLTIIRRHFPFHSIPLAIGFIYCLPCLFISIILYNCSYYVYLCYVLLLYPPE